jgi:hypothetical protein
VQAFPAHSPELRFTHDLIEAGQKLNVSFWPDPSLNKPRRNCRKVSNPVYRGSPDDGGFRAATITSSTSDLKAKAD